MFFQKPPPTSFVTTLTTAGTNSTTADTTSTSQEPSTTTIVTTSTTAGTASSTADTTPTSQETTFTTPDITTSQKSSTTIATTSTTTISSSTTLMATETTTEPLNPYCCNKPVPPTLCPEGFNSLKLENKEYCVWFKENQPFPPNCPYPHPLPYYLSRNLTIRLNKTVWLNAFRNDNSSGFPDFEWLDNGQNYSQPVAETISNLKDGFGKNCLVIRNNDILRVDCQEKHTTVCVYWHFLFDSSTASKRCNDMQEDRNCALANYDLKFPTCFCERIKPSRSSKNEFCNKLIEPSPFQSEILKGSLRFTMRTCWIGLYKDTTSIEYRWSSSKQIVNYTYWVSSHDCKHSEGGYQFNSSQSGWVLSEDRTLNCALCEISANYKDASIQLQFIKAKGIIQLRVSNPQTISNLQDALLNYYDVYCFSDNDETKFKKSLNISIKPLSDNKQPYLIHDIRVPYDHPSYYWCEAFHYPSFTPIKSNTIVALNKPSNYGHEFSMNVTFTFDTRDDPVIDKIFIEVCQTIRDRIAVSWNHLLSLRPLRGYMTKNGTMNMIVHITTGNPLQNASEQQKELLEILKLIKEPHLNLSILLSSEVCLFTTTVAIDKKTLEWPETKIGATAIPSNCICLNEDNKLPVTRDCLGDFLTGARWAEPKGNCIAEKNHSSITEELFELTKDNVPIENITKALEKITKDPSDIEVIDIHLIATLLETIEANATIISVNKTDRNFSYIEIVSNIMNFNRKDLKEAQLSLNSTDRILAFLDGMLSVEKATLLSSQNVLVEVINITDESIIGLTLQREVPAANSFEHFKISLLYSNVSIENITKIENLEIAVLLPSYEKEGINVTKNPITLVATMFSNDSLFNPNETEYLVHTYYKTISISASSLTGFLNTPLRILFKISENAVSSKNCSHWNYGLDDQMVSIHGYWADSGIKNSTFEFIKICEFYHMTHFGLFLKDNQDKDINDHALNILTAIGSILTLIGIVPIFITAAVFKHWRSRTGNIILLNFCSAITLQTTLTLSLYGINKDGVLCKILGVLIHYSILSEFCWMITIAMLQYVRFVIIFSTPDPKILFKNLLIGWVAPLIPVVLTASISLESYEFNDHKFCYVTGNCFYYGLLLPIILMLIVNVTIFVRIIYAISQSNIANMQKSRNYKLEVFLAILLFFILGISWLFGIAGAFGGGIFFTYIFCMTASIRGFVLFLFFIVANKETRILWKKRATYYIETSARRLS